MNTTTTTTVVNGTTYETSVEKEDMTEFFERFNLIFNKQHLFREFFAGGFAGSIGIFVGFPFDSIKVKLQAHPTKYGTAMDCFRQSVKEEGFRGLYNGCLPPIVLQGMINSLLFFGESSTMHLLEPNLKPGEMCKGHNAVIAGCAGGLLQCVLLVPSDVIKCTMQAHEVNPKIPNTVPENAFVSTWKCMKEIYRTEGVRGFYKGFGATVLRECPSIGLYFFSYKTMKESFRKIEGTEVPSTKSILISGGVAGAVSWTVVYPMDVIKTNMQITPVEEAKNKDGKITGVSMTKYLYRKYGWRTFFRGIGTTVLRAFPVNASTFFVYERLKEIYHFD